VSLDAAGGQLPHGVFEQSTVSDDGRYVGFGTQDGAVPEDTENVSDAYVRDTVTGAVTWLTRNETGEPSTAGSAGAVRLAGDGSVAVFAASDPLVSRDHNQATDVYLRDLRTGRLELVSLRSDGTVSSEGGTEPSVSRNGRYVALTSKDLDLPPGGTTGRFRVYVRDRALGTTTLVSVADNGAVLDGSSVEPRITANGRHVVMVSDSRASDGGRGRFDRVLERLRWADRP
jgi:Tol biopolymer transport system component